MKNVPVGHSKIVIRYMGFLVNRYQMKIDFQLLPDTEGIEDPTYVYSFYNNWGCLTLLEVAQRGEWDCYVSDRFDSNPYSRLKTKINQREYCSREVYFVGSFLRITAKSIQRMILETKSIWGIRIE